jgi:hypothetical protein
MAQITLNSTGVASNGSLVLQSNGTTAAVTVDTSQNVGIGTGSPAYKLDVKAASATVGITSTTGTNAVYSEFINTGGSFFVGRENSAGTSFSTSAYSSVLFSAGAYPMAFFTNSLLRMSINSSGRVGVGVLPTTTTKFQVVSDGTNIASFQDNSAQGIKYVVSTDGAGQIKHLATWESSGVAAYHAWYVTTSAGVQPQAMTLNVNGALALLGASTSATGVGITFPATQSASTDANTLDDYEEGTWTPTVAAASVTYTNRYGTYTKIGNVVYISCFVQIATITSPTGGAGANFISGLPFTSLPFTSAYYPNFATSWNGSNFGGTVGMAQMASSSTALSALASTNNAAFVDSSPADIWDANGNSVKITGFYFV